MVPDELDEHFLERIWYIPFCNKEEIDRILNPKTAKDYLLKRRADIVADHSRYLRVYINRRRKYGYQSFEETFSDTHYLAFLNKLNEQDKTKCSMVSYGDIFYKDFNAYTECTDYGVIIYLNQSLHYFTYFMNLALLDFKGKVPLHVRVNALRIAIRISLEKESMDFDMDPRGIVPKKISKKIDELASLEKQFVAGHEFSHYLCGHLKETSPRKIHISDDRFISETIYNIDQKREFEADLSSISRPNYSNKEKSYVIYASILFFASLDIVEYVNGVINPIDIGYKDHPRAIERLYKILDTFHDDALLSHNEINKMLKCLDFYKKIIKNDLDNNFDLYDFYGSCYLDEPNTKWRGKQLIDRIDY